MHRMHCRSFNGMLAVRGLKFRVRGKNFDARDTQHAGNVQCPSTTLMSWCISSIPPWFLCSASSLRSRTRKPHSMHSAVIEMQQLSCSQTNRRPFALPSRLGLGSGLGIGLGLGLGLSLQTFFFGSDQGELA